jgi:alkylation response protein AidB-like acyl-CoA dehydrogenase
MSVAIPTRIPTTGGHRLISAALGDAGCPWLQGLDTAAQQPRIMDIFEGTEQIQQLVISRAISGLRIE